MLARCAGLRGRRRLTGALADRAAPRPAPCSKSATRSSTSSSPTETRTRPAEIPACAQARLVELAMRARRRMDGHRAHAAQRGGSWRDGQRVEERRRRRTIAEVEGEHAAAGTQDALGNGGLRVAGQARVVDRPDQRLACLEQARQRASALAVWRSMRTCSVSMPRSTRKARQRRERCRRCRSGRRGWRRSVAARRRRRRRARPSGRRSTWCSLDDEVGAVLDRPAEVRRGERVVDRRASGRARCAISARAGRSATTMVGLAIVSTWSRRVRSVIARGVNCVEIGDVDEGASRCPGGRRRSSSRCLHAAVQRLAGDDVVACRQQRQQRGVDGGHAGREGEAGLGAFDLGDGVGRARSTLGCRCASTSSRACGRPGCRPARPSPRR